MYNVLDVAIYVINYAHDTGCGESMSNLKLQKILYYIQIAFLLKKNKECFKAVIIAGEFGPVIPEVYQKYKIYGRRGIPKQENRKVLQLDCEKMRIIKKEITEISRGDKRLIEKVVDTYAAITEPIALAKKTCEEDPWKNIIAKKKMYHEIRITGKQKRINVFKEFAIVVIKNWENVTKLCVSARAFEEHVKSHCKC